MYYVCVENDQVISVLNYEPNVPESVTVFEISDEDHGRLSNDNYCFNIKEGCVELKSADELNQLNIEKERQQNKSNLASTDWKVMRHIREKALGLPTTLTEEEYIELEKLRHQWANFLNQ